MVKSTQCRQHVPAHYEAGPQTASMARPFATRAGQWAGGVMSESRVATGKSLRLSHPPKNLFSLDFIGSGGYLG